MNVFNSVVLPMPAGPVSATTRGASPARTRASSARSVSSSGRASVEVSAFVSLTPACCHSTSTLRQSSVSRICGGSQKWRVADKHGDRTRTTTLHTVRAYHSGQEVHRAARDPCLPEVAGDTDSGHEAGVRLLVETDDLIQGYIYLFGVWEPNITDWIRRTLLPGDTFVDVGSNIGYYSTLAARLVGSAGSVVAIDA